MCQKITKSRFAFNKSHSKWTIRTNLSSFICQESSDKHQQSLDYIQSANKVDLLFRLTLIEVVLDKLLTICTFLQQRIRDSCSMS